MTRGDIEAKYGGPRAACEAFLEHHMSREEDREFPYLCDKSLLLVVALERLRVQVKGLPQNFALPGVIQ